MSIALKDFVGNITNIVRPNRFYVIIEPPTYEDGSPIIDFSMSSNELMFYVQSATIPDRTFGDIELKYFGMTLKLPGNESISDLTITFINNADWNIRDFFEGWADVINNRSDSVKGYVGDLFNTSSITVYQLGYKGETIAGYQFFNIFPKVLSEMELNMDTTDSHETFQVTFDYSHFIQIEVGE